MKWFINCSLVKPKYSILIRFKKKMPSFFILIFILTTDIDLSFQRAGGGWGLTGWVQRLP